MRNTSERQLQALGVFVHGALTFGHLLGIMHNWRRRNWFDVAAHGAAATYDIYAVTKHMRQLEELAVNLRTELP